MGTCGKYLEGIIVENVLKDPVALLYQLLEESELAFGVNTFYSTLPSNVLLIGTR